MNSRSAEVVVVGGGAVGTAVACFLSRKGIKAALVEKGEFAWGTSRRCDGNIATYDSPPGYFSQLCKKGVDLFDALLPELEYDIHLDKTGFALLVDDEEDLETAKINYQGKKAEGVPVEFWDRAELRKRVPLVADHVQACLDFKCDGSVNPMRLAFALADLARRRGATLYPRTMVKEIKVSGGSVAGVETSGGFISAPKVILCAGVWTPEIARSVGLEVPVRPRQGQILVTERQKGLPDISFGEFGYLAAKAGKKRKSVTPLMEEYGVAMVLEPTRGGTFLIGSSRRYVGMNTEPSPAVLKALAQRAINFFPCIAGANAIRSYAGVRPATPDGKPIISVTPVNGLYLATGHEGNGIGLSLITGHLVSQMLTGGPTDLDLAPLGLGRFSMEAAEQPK